MHKNYFKFLYWLSPILFLSSCSSTNLMSLTVTEPAPIYIPAKEKIVGILNRSEPSKENKVIDEIDKILSIEGKNLDKEGAQNIILGLQDELNKNNGFTEVKLIEDKTLKSPGLSVFPAPISWEAAEKIGKQNNIDYIFELSFYDTDTKVNYKTINTEISNIAGIKIPIIEHQATISTLIKNGWRIYDIKNHKILNEIEHANTVNAIGKGINPMKAIEAVLGRKQSVLQASTQAGQEYALKTLPYNIRVSRDYFVSGTNNFTIAKRRALTGNWDGAAELWLKETTNPDPKIAGRAYYNMAIINEINGNSEKAIDFASKSYADYGNKTALYYLNTLKRRLQKNEQLKRESN